LTERVLDISKHLREEQALRVTLGLEQAQIMLQIEGLRGELKGSKVDEEAFNKRCKEVLDKVEEGKR
jgi:hypothetical protein